VHNLSSFMIYKHRTPDGVGGAGTLTSTIDMTHRRIGTGSTETLAVSLRRRVDSSPHTTLTSNKPNSFRQIHLLKHCFEPWLVV